MSQILGFSLLDVLPLKPYTHQLHVELTVTL